MATITMVTMTVMNKNVILLMVTISGEKKLLSLLSMTKISMW